MNQVVSVLNKTNPLKIWNAFRRWPIIPVAILSILLFTGIFAPLLAPESPTAQTLKLRNAPPSWMENGAEGKFLGADHVGRDVFSRIIHGARISLFVVIISLASGVLVGSTLGLISGYAGGFIDEFIMRIYIIWTNSIYRGALDSRLALPFVLLALIAAIVLGPSVRTVMILLALFTWASFVRYVRAEVLTLKTRDYVALAKVAGASTTRIIVKHILPNVFNTIIVVATLRVGQLILTEATLSFVGAGIPAPTPAWGLMVSEEKEYLNKSWWGSFFPGFAIFLVVMSLNFLGDWLRDKLDPRLRQL